MGTPERKVQLGASPRGVLVGGERGQEPWLCSWGCYGGLPEPCPISQVPQGTGLAPCLPPAVWARSPGSENLGICPAAACGSHCSQHATSYACAHRVLQGGRACGEGEGEAGWGVLPARPRWQSHTYRTGRCPEAPRGRSPLRKTAAKKTRQKQVVQGPGAPGACCVLASLCTLGHRAVWGWGSARPGAIPHSALSL